MAAAAYAAPSACGPRSLLTIGACSFLYQPARFIVVVVGICLLLLVMTSHHHVAALLLVACVGGISAQ